MKAYKEVESVQIFASSNAIIKVVEVFHFGHCLYFYVRRAFYKFFNVQISYKFINIRSSRGQFLCHA